MAGAGDDCTVGMMEWLADPDARFDTSGDTTLFWKLSLPFLFWY